MIWVDILMTTLLFLVALHLWNLSVTNLKSISNFARFIFVLKSILLFFTALSIWISHFGSFLWLMLQFFSTIGISLTFVWLCWIIHVLCHWWPWKFCCVENFPMASEGDKIDCRQWLSLISKIIWGVRGALCLHTVMIFQSALFGNMTCIFPPQPSGLEGYCRHGPGGC